uniref:NTR domain-containing protein n=1 Tax=Knipowitschia caucasica TaxID=637954 RepID=A0AAV2JV36_KNICA
MGYCPCSKGWIKKPLVSREDQKQQEDQRRNREGAGGTERTRRSRRIREDQKQQEDQRRIREEQEDQRRIREEQEEQRGPGGAGGSERTRSSRRIRGGSERSRRNREDQKQQEDQRRIREDQERGAGGTERTRGSRRIREDQEKQRGPGGAGGPERTRRNREDQEEQEDQHHKWIDKGMEMTHDKTSPDFPLDSKNLRCRGPSPDRCKCKNVRMGQKTYLKNNYNYVIRARVREVRNRGLEPTALVEVREVLKSSLVNIPRDLQTLYYSSSCLCPPLTLGEEYLIMGYESEERSRLLLIDGSIAQKWKDKMAKKIKRWNILQEGGAAARSGHAH